MAILQDDKRFCQWFTAHATRVSAFAVAGHPWTTFTKAPSAVFPLIILILLDYPILFDYPIGVTHGRDDSDGVREEAEKRL